MWHDLMTLTMHDNHAHPFQRLHYHQKCSLQNRGAFTCLKYILYQPYNIIIKSTFNHLPNLLTTVQSFPEAERKKSITSSLQINLILENTPFHHSPNNTSVQMFQTAAMLFQFHFQKKKKSCKNQTEFLHSSPLLSHRKE